MNKIEKVQKAIFEHIERTQCRTPEDCFIIYQMLKGLKEPKGDSQ